MKDDQERRWVLACSKPCVHLHNDFGSFCKAKHSMVEVPIFSKLDLPWGPADIFVPRVLLDIDKQCWKSHSNAVSQITHSALLFIKGNAKKGKVAAMAQSVLLNIDPDGSEHQWNALLW